MTTTSAFGVDGNGATGPGASSAYTGPFTAGMAFKVTSSGLALLGYGYWRADSSQGAAPSFGLWTITGASTGTFISGSGVSLAGGVTGQWNYVMLGTPVALTSGTPYKAVYGQANNFSDTQNQFGGGADPYKAGIVNGPLTVYSDVASNGGTLAEPNGSFQGTFGTAGSDPTVNYPATADVSSNFWLDVLVGPAGVSRTATAALTVTPSLSVSAGIRVPVSLTVVPSFAVARVQGHARVAALTAVPGFQVARSGGEVRSGGSMLVLMPATGAC